MPSYLFENCNLYDGVGDTMRDGMHVLTDGVRVTEVSDRPIKAASAHRIKVDGRTLMPGLIDAHVHITATVTNLGTLQGHPPSLIAAGAARIAYEMLMRGFTTVRDAAGADWGHAEAIESGLFHGPRLFFAGQALSQTGGHGDFRPRTFMADGCACGQAFPSLGRIADGPTEVRRAARDELRKGANQIKIMAGGGVASPTDPIQNTQYSAEEMRIIVEEAEAWHTYVMAHAYTGAAIRRAVTAGIRTIEHGNLIDAEAAQLMAEKKAYLVPTLATYDALGRYGRELGFPEVSLMKLTEVQAAGLRSIEIAKAAGVRIGHGSDLLGAMHVHQLTEFSIRRDVLSPAELLASATRINAEILMRPKELGLVAPGALADLLVVDGDPMADIGVLTQPEKRLLLIMKGGTIYKDTAALH